MRLLFSILLLSNFCFAQIRPVVILPGNADLSTNIRTAISDQNASIISIERPGGGDIRITGTIDFKGKVLKLSSGTKIIGTAPVISNAVIDASYNQQIFSANTKLQNVIVTGLVVSVKWFGATGDGVTDDQPAIQAAGEAIIQNNSLPRTLYFPHGSYRINKELFFYNWSGTDYAFFSLNLLGQEGAYFNNTLTEARIIATHTNTFAIGYQMARSSLIKGLVIQGQFNPPGSGNYREYVSRPYATWANGVADNPTAPYSGIVIDPVDNSNSLGITGRYQTLENMYRGTGANMNSGCSGIKIEQCRISGFAICIAVSLNSITSNAENVHIIDCALEIAKAAVAYGQDQTKDNYIIRCISWERVHTLVDTKNYGRGTGQAPYVDGWNIAGDVIQLWQLNPLRAACNWRNVFAEGIWRIGDGDAGAGLSIESSTINFKLGELVPPTHVTGAKIIFKGCVIKYYDNQYNKRMRMIGADYRFEDCELDRVPLFNPAYGFERLTPAQFINCVTGDGQLGKPYAKGQYSANNYYVTYGQMIFEEGGLLQGSSYNGIKDLKISFNFSWPLKEQRLDVITIWPVNNGEVKITGTKNLVAAGDYITTESGIVIGRVASVNRIEQSAQLVDVPIDILGGFSGHCITNWVDRLAGQFIGDLSEGSNQITNIEYDILLPQPYVGQRLKIGHSSITPIVEAVTGSTITMSIASDYSHKEAFNSFDRSQLFELTTPQGTAGNWPVLIPKGAKFYKREETLICTKAGFWNAAAIGKKNQAEFKIIN